MKLCPLVHRQIACLHINIRSIPDSAMLVTADVVFWIFRKSFSTNIRNSYDTKFAPPYACIYMDEVETEVLQTQRFKPLVWLWFIDDIFFIWAHGEKNLNITILNPILSLFLNVIKILLTSLISIIVHLIQIILNGQLFRVKLYEQNIYVHLKKIL